MQSLGVDVIKQVKYKRMKKLDDFLLAAVAGEMIVCPICNYVGKNKRGSAKVFDNDGRKTMKCFSCGIWRAG